MNPDHIQAWLEPDPDEAFGSYANALDIEEIGQRKLFKMRIREGSGIDSVFVMVNFGEWTWPMIEVAGNGPLATEDDCPAEPNDQPRRARKEDWGVNLKVCPGDIHTLARSVPFHSTSRGTFYDVSEKWGKTTYLLYGFNTGGLEVYNYGEIQAVYTSTYRLQRHCGGIELDQVYQISDADYHLIRGETVEIEFWGAKVQGGQEPITYSLDPIPEGMSFNSSELKLHGTPTGGEGCTVTAMTLTVTDGAGASIEKPFKLT